ncbi:MAG TPA: virulence factor SrfB [Crenalkalicoccus sp.]|nr:virulence factor SrfB [Crenalkalicoccus sp.]
MQGLPQIVSLVPRTGLQFLDIRFALERLPRAPRSFWEQPLPPGQEGAAPNLVNLRPLAADNDGGLLDPVSGRTPPEEEVYQIGRAQALEMALGRWLPLPFFRVVAVAGGGREIYDKGPTNWVRLRVAALPEPDEEGNTHHAVLAFDTALRAREEGRPYTAISPDDSERAGEFAFVADREWTTWFMNEPWMGQWLAEVLSDARAATGRRPREEELARACEHWARYITLLNLIAEAGLMPRIKLVDVVSSSRAYEPINVDLVLDIGNARTCGILVEDERDSRLNLNNSYRLKLRDLGRPELCYDQPFESRVEFARASFGKDAIARRAGRSNAFLWASPVRVGPEAVRLSAAARGNEGATGLSSPKRYLWDDRATAQVWRFNGMAADGVTTEPPVSGGFMALVTEEGEVVRGPRRRGAVGPRHPAVRARFSRSSLMTFLLAEVLLQALSQINAVETRYARRFPDVPRQLRRILLTMPPAMALAEQRIFRDRAEAAVRLAWDMLGWGQGGPSTPPEPRVLANLDEATATQIVFLYTEASQRLRGDPGGLFALSGRVRPEHGAGPSLRVASIDIGGGTTDLMICTYTAEQGGQEIVPRQNFREGFRIAGDEVMQEVIQGILLPQLEEALAKAGARDAKALLREVLGGDRGSQSELERHLRRQLVAQVLEPAGLAVLHAYEKVTGRTNGEILRATLGEVLTGRDVAAPVRYLEQQAARAGAAEFRLLGVEFAATAGRVDAVVQAALGPVIADLCEVVWSFDCDWLLLSGRPSRLRGVTDMVLAKVPVPPHRIVGMHRYAAGSWYPFRDPAGRVDDPKTTAAVGAMLCAVAEGRLEGFLMRTSRLAMRSTARFLGRMELSGQILRENVLLRDPDREPAAAGPAGAAPPEVKFQMAFRAPVFLGFRQLDLERWTASRLYILEYANPDNVPRLKLPLRLSIRRSEIDPERADAEELREDFTIDEILDAEGDPQHRGVVRLRLQTERDEAGYWRDTGALAVP